MLPPPGCAHTVPGAGPAGDAVLGSAWRSAGRCSRCRQHLAQCSQSRPSGGAVCGGDGGSPDTAGPPFLQGLRAAQEEQAVAAGAAAEEACRAGTAGQRWCAVPAAAARCAGARPWLAWSPFSCTHTHRGQSGCAAVNTAYAMVLDLEAAGAMLQGGSLLPPAYAGACACCGLPGHPQPCGPAGGCSQPVPGGQQPPAGGTAHGGRARAAGSHRSCRALPWPASCPGRRPSRPCRQRQPQ